MRAALCARRGSADAERRTPLAQYDFPSKKQKTGSGKCCHRPREKESLRAAGLLLRIRNDNLGCGNCFRARAAYAVALHNAVNLAGNDGRDLIDYALLTDAFLDRLLDELLAASNIAVEF